jgi:hypothetical protein
MKPLKRIVALLSGLVVVPALVTPILAQSAGPNAAFSTGSSMQKVKTVFVIMMENKNWTGNNTGASFGDPRFERQSLGALHQRRPLQYLGTSAAVLQPSGKSPRGAFTRRFVRSSLRILLAHPI